MTVKAKQLIITPHRLILVSIYVLLVETIASEVTLNEISNSVVRSLTNCDEQNDTLSACLKRRSILILDKYSRAADTINLMSDSLLLVKSVSGNSTESNRSLGSSGLTQEKLDEYLPVDERSRQKVLDTLLVGSLSKFLQSRSLQLRIPQMLARYVSYGLSEGRARKQGRYYGAFILGALLVAGTLIPIKMGTLALLSGKALMTSVLALTLAGIVAVKKLSGDSKSASTTYEVINVPAGGHGGGHGHHARSLPLSTLPPEIVDPTFLPKLISQNNNGPYSAYKTNYVYNDSVNSSPESDYV